MTYKFCKACSTDKPISEFYTNGRYKGVQKHKPTCKICETGAKRKKHIALITEFYGEIKCQKCGFIGEFIQYDLHHSRPEEKSFGIADGMNSNYSNEKLISEFKKCDLLCACCHRLEHMIEYPD